LLYVDYTVKFNFEYKFNSQEKKEILGYSTDDCKSQNINLFRGDMNCDFWEN